MIRKTTGTLYIGIGLVIVIIISLTFSIFINEIEGFDRDVDRIDYYVISMKVPERITNMEDQQKKMTSTLNIFDAVNGDTLDIHNIDGIMVTDEFKSEDRHRKREIGCYLSHYGVLRTIKESGDPNGYTVIFEDDFQIIVDNFEDQIKKTLYDMKDHDFDLLYVDNLSNNKGEPFIENVCKMDHAKDMWGTQSYIVKNKNIGKLLEQCSKIDMPIDWKYITGIKSGKLNAYTFCPYLTSSRGFESTMSSTMSI